MSRLASHASAVACGAVAACLYLAVIFGTPGAMILAYMAQLPLFVAGLWFGTMAAVIAGLSGTALLFATNDVLGALVFVAVNAAPVALLVRQALLAREREDGSYAWYPPGRLTAWLAGYALAGFGLALLFVGGPQELRDTVREIIEPVLGAQRGDNREQAAATLTRVVPGMVTASWMIMTVINGSLAQGLLARFRHNWRPSPQLASLALPLWLPIALGLAAAGVVFGGALRFIGINVMIALFVPFCLAGLAVVHTAARRLRQPAMALVFFYTTAGLFGWPFIAVAILGLLESGLGLRRRLTPHGVNIDG